MKKLLIASALLVASPALAQQAPPPDPAQELGQDYQAFTTAQKHLIEDIQKLIKKNQTLKAENAKLKAPPTPAPPTSPTP